MGSNIKEYMKVVPSMPGTIRKSVDCELPLRVGGASGITLELARRVQVPDHNIVSENRLM